MILGFVVGAAVYILGAAFIYGVCKGWKPPCSQDDALGIAIFWPFLLVVGIIAGTIFGIGALLPYLFYPVFLLGKKVGDKLSSEEKKEQASPESSSSLPSSL